MFLLNNKKQINKQRKIFFLIISLQTPFFFYFRKPYDPVLPNIDEQEKRLRKVDELVQEAEKTLQKIRAQHERYEKQEMKGTSPITFDNVNLGEQEVPDAFAEESLDSFELNKKEEEIQPRYEETKQIIKSLYLNNTVDDSTSSSDVSAALKTPSENSSEDNDDVIAVTDYAQSTPSPKKEVKDVEVATVSTLLQDESVLVTTAELMEDKSANTSPIREACVGKQNKSGIMFFF